MLERDFQKGFIKELQERIPEITVIKNDSGYKQGFPDWTAFYKDKYALLEIKKDEDSIYRPNQELYLSTFGEYTYTATVIPSNKEEVINELVTFFGI